MAKRNNKKNVAVDNVVAEPVVSSEQVNEVVETSQEVNEVEVTSQQQEKKMFTFKLQRDSEGNPVLTHAGHASYKVEGRSGILRVAPQLFDNPADLPDTIDAALPLPEATVREAKVKMTAEERKAARAAMTPAQRLEEQEARLEKQRKNLEARKAKLGLLAAEDEAEDVDGDDDADVDSEGQEEATI